MGEGAKRRDSNHDDALLSVKRRRGPGAGQANFPPPPSCRVLRCFLSVALNLRYSPPNRIPALKTRMRNIAAVCGAIGGLVGAPGPVKGLVYVERIIFLDPEHDISGQHGHGYENIGLFRSGTMILEGSTRACDTRKRLSLRVYYTAEANRTERNR